jgi:hypothetical protein
MTPHYSPTNYHLSARGWIASATQSTTIHCHIIHAMCRQMYLDMSFVPHVIDYMFHFPTSYLPPVCLVNIILCHVSPYDRDMWNLYERATCHPSSGDTCHLLVAPCKMYEIFQLCFHISCAEVQLEQSSAMWHCTVYTVSVFFACLEK